MKKFCFIIVLLSAVMLLSSCTLFDTTECNISTCEALDIEHSTGYAGGGPWGNTNAAFATGGRIRIKYDYADQTPSFMMTHPLEYFDVYYYTEPKYNQYSYVKMTYWAPGVNKVDIQNVLNNRRINLNEPEFIRRIGKNNKDSTVDEYCSITIPLSAIKDFNIDDLNTWIGKIKYEEFAEFPFEIDWQAVEKTQNEWKALREEFEKGGKTNIVDGIDLTLTEPNEVEDEVFVYLYIHHKAFEESIYTSKDKLIDTIRYRAEDLSNKEIVDNEKCKNNPTVLAKYSILRDLLGCSSYSAITEDSYKETYSFSIEIPIDKLNTTSAEIKDWIRSIEPDKFEILEFPFKRKD